MLLCSWKGTLNLLPALPKALPRGTITGIRARGQITIDRLAWDKPAGKLNLELTSAIGQTITVCLPHAKAIREITAVGAVAKDSSHGTNARQLQLPAGKTVSLQIAFAEQ